MIEPGERVLLLGPSGAGKSTLLTALAGLHDPETSGESEGELRIDGLPARDVRGRTGLVLQDPEAQLVMARVGDDVAFGLENDGVAPERIWSRVQDALRAVGFDYDLDRSTSALSGGEKQRLALAGVLARRPGLLLLDEPTANLDPAGAALVRTALADAQAATGVTTVLVEHRIAEALPLVDRVVVVAAGGGVVADGPPQQVFDQHGDRLARDGVWVPGRSRPTRLATRPCGPQVLSGRGLSYAYAGSQAVAYGDVALHAGEAVALTGANGTGKSTLATLLAGLRTPARGAVRAAGVQEPLHRWRARRLAAGIGTVFQEPEHQFLATTVAAELDLGSRRQELPAADVTRRTGMLLERLHLDHLAAANPFTLSGGEKRRLSVATALVTEPPVLVLDEPTFGQDSRTWDELLGLLGDLRDDGRAVLAVTHDEEFAVALADRRLVLA